jgi:hypothetical protein
MIPLYYQNKAGARMMVLAVFFILFVPFASVSYLPVASFAGDRSFQALIGLQMSTIALIIATAVVQCRLALFESPMYAFAAPLSGAIISFSFISAIADARKKGAVNWRDRQYTISRNQHPIQ